MALQIIVNKLKKLFLFLLGLIKRSLCCLRRRRRLSCDSIPLNEGGEGGISYDAQNHDIESWAWEETEQTPCNPNSVQHHIEVYRQQSVKVPPEEEPQPNYFEDMTPKITQQPKIPLMSQDEEQTNQVSSRLNFMPVLAPVEELGSWEENEVNGSWETTESWDAAQLVKEKRRADREKRSLNKNQGRTTLGSKVS